MAIRNAIRINGKLETKEVALNRRAAVHYRCLDCSCWNPQEVTNCKHEECPLYPFRTGKGNQKAKARNKAIKDYCLWCNGSKQEVTLCPVVNCALYVYRTSGKGSKTRPYTRTLEGDQGQALVIPLTDNRSTIEINV